MTEAAASVASMVDTPLNHGIQDLCGLAVSLE